MALVIGNGNYSEPLNTATENALDMARALKAAGFQVIQRLNADKRQMSDAIGAFRQRLRRGGVGLVYYVGYAMHIAGRNHLLPVHSDIDSEAAAAFEAVDLGSLIEAMEAADTRVDIVILDACRAHSEVERLPAAAPGLARLESDRGVFIALAASPGTVAAAPPVGGNSLYTTMLLESMSVPGRTLTEVFRTTREMVTGVWPSQVPWFSSSSSEEFVFRFAAREAGEENTPSTIPEDDKARSRRWLWVLLGLGVAGSIAVASGDGDADPPTGGVEIEVVVP